MRTAVLVIAGLEFLMVLGGILKIVIAGWRSGSDLAGQGMTMAYMVIATLIVVVLAGPALALAWNGKLLGLALVLSVLALVPALVVLVME